MDNLWQDIRFGFRMLWKAPSFSLIAIAALALGIGANTAIFSVVNAVLLRPLPFPESSHLLSVYHYTQPQIEPSLPEVVGQIAEPVVSPGEAIGEGVLNRHLPVAGFERG